MLPYPKNTPNLENRVAKIRQKGLDILVNDSYSF
jgi:hypothetical protein